MLLRPPPTAQAGVEITEEETDLIIGQHVRDLRSPTAIERLAAIDRNGRERRRR